MIEKKLNARSREEKKTHLIYGAKYAESWVRGESEVL